jgi:hypothetical protein
MIQGSHYEILLYVDDLIHSCNDNDEAQFIADLLTLRYGVMDHHFGSKISFLSLSINVDHYQRMITIDQTGYINNFLSQVEKKYQIIPSEYPSTAMLSDHDHMSTGIKLDKKITKIFRSYLMSLMYVALRTRSDILFVVTFLSTAMQSPTDLHLSHLLKVSVTITRSSNDPTEL